MHKRVFLLNIAGLDISLSYNGLKKNFWKNGVFNNVYDKKHGRGFACHIVMTNKRERVNWQQHNKTHINVHDMTFPQNTQYVQIV